MWRTLVAHNCPVDSWSDSQTLGLGRVVGRVCSVAGPLSCGVHLSALPWMCMQCTLPPWVLSAACVWCWSPCECAFALSLPRYCQDHSLLHLPKGLNIGDSFWTCLLFLLPKLEQFYTLVSVYTCEHSSLLWMASKKEIVLFFALAHSFILPLGKTCLMG